ncbi:MAG: hypothetical protein LBQ43_00200 [Holosporales bacterium]|jgi:hypothetical protein|nr:hypothetical protein [Holosporales bacterium]
MSATKICLSLLYLLASECCNSAYCIEASSESGNVYVRGTGYMDLSEPFITNGIVSIDEECMCRISNVQQMDVLKPFLIKGKLILGHEDIEEYNAGIEEGFFLLDRGYDYLSINLIDSGKVVFPTEWTVKRFDCLEAFEKYAKQHCHGQVARG